MEVEEIEQRGPNRQGTQQRQERGDKIKLNLEKLVNDEFVGDIKLADFECEAGYGNAISIEHNLLGGIEWLGDRRKNCYHAGKGNYYFCGG